MPTINEEVRFNELRSDVNHHRRVSTELDELDEIEGEFIQFVLPWLKLVPQGPSKDHVISYKVRQQSGIH